VGVVVCKAVRILALGDPFSGLFSRRQDKIIRRRSLLMACDQFAEGEFFDLGFGEAKNKFKSKRNFGLPPILG
jgi:hypothetical protein